VNHLRRIFLRFYLLFADSKAEADLAREIAAHLVLLEDEYLCQGMSPEDARRAARLAYGGVEQAKELHRDERSFQGLSQILQDARYAFRQLRKSPAFTAVAVLTLALGIGANTAIFSVVNGVLLNPLPFHEPEQLIALHASMADYERGSISYPNFLDWQKESHSFSAMAIYRAKGMSLTGMGEAERINGEFVSSDFFSLLGVKPLIGRTLAAGEDRIGAGPVVLISEGLWRRQFDSSPRVLGKIVTLDGKGFAVIGVVPASFHMGSIVPTLLEQEVYVPIGQWEAPVLMRGNGLGIEGIGRLRPGVTMKQARADMAAVTEELARVYPDSDKGLGATLDPLKEQVVGESRPVLLVLLAAVGFVLLIACVNVANLLLVRSISRGREFAVRAALGAGRARIIRQLLVESVLLAAAGGSLGLLVATWGTRAALALLPATLPRAEDIGLDPRVLFFTATVSLLTGIFFGTVPALRASRQDMNEALKEGGRGASGARHRTQKTFVAVEVALALVLLVGAGLVIRSMATLWGVDTGFDRRDVLIFSYGFPPGTGNASADELRAQCRELQEKVESIPHVQAAGLTWAAFPMLGEDDMQFWLEGQAKPEGVNDMDWALSYVVEPQYFRAMGIPLLRGRLFTDRDNERAPLVVVVDEIFARKFFPAQNPIGKRIQSEEFDQLAEIVGVVGHVKQWGLDADDANPLRAQIYRHLMQTPVAVKALPVTRIGVVVRSSANPTELTNAIRRVTGEMSRDRVVWEIKTMEEVISDSLAGRRFAMMLLVSFAALGLLMASVGIYGIYSYFVNQRTHEIGVRLALGARQADVLWSVLGDGARTALAGLAPGFIVALSVTRLLARYSLLFGVSPRDPLTFATVALLLFMVALAASYIPARRATKVDPMVALRYE
jgi:predicted permease